MGFDSWNFGEGGGDFLLRDWCEKTSFKCSYWAQGLEDHVPHPTDGLNMSRTTRFRHVLTMVLDGVRLLEFGKEGLVHEKALKMILHRKPIIRNRKSEVGKSNI